MKILRILLWIFKIFGICSWTPYDREGNSNELLLLAWKVLHLILASSLLISIFCVNFQIFDDSSPISAFTDMMQFVMPSIAHHTILIESFWFYKTQRKIWSFPCKVSGHLCNLGVDIQPVIDDVLWGYLNQIIWVQGISFGTELLIIYGIAIGHGGTGWMYHWLYKLLPFSMGRMSLLFHGLFIIYINTYTKAISTEIHHVGTLSKRKSLKESILVSKLQILKNLYTNLALMNQHVNKIFPFSHMMNVLSIFITLAACFYWYCATLRRGTKHPLETVLCPVGAIISITHITLTCQKSHQNVMKLAHEINRIEIKEEQKLLRDIIESFALQIEHQPIRHCAGTLFEVNAVLLKDIFAITCTFIVIFVQFMPKGY